MKADNILEEIHNAGLKLLVPLSLSEVYKTVVEEAVRLVNGDDGLIVREIDNQLKTVYGSTKNAASYIVRNRGNSFIAFTEHKSIIMHGKEVKKAYTTFPNQIK